jgi:SAM-dependent methyltransferase
MSSTFDDQAAAYDRWFSTPLGRLVDKVEKQAIFSLAPEVQGRRILEIGCGTGNFSLALAHKRAWQRGVIFPSSWNISRNNQELIGNNLHQYFMNLDSYCSR